MKKILIIGSEGSMGRRYQAILNFLEVSYGCVDKGNKFEFPYREYDGYIVCSPTESHFNIIKLLAPLKKPILCEKPMIMQLTRLEKVLSEDIDLDIMFQYKELINPNPEDKGPFKSHYDYFRTGKDGLCWDCMQIISLHQGEFKDLSIHNFSPVWTCVLNNQELNFQQMDMAYISYLAKWIDGRRTPKVDIFNYHQKVVDFIFRSSKK